MDQKTKPTAQPKKKVDHEKIKQEQKTEERVDPWELLLFGRRKPAPPESNHQEKTTDVEKDYPFSWI